MASFINSNQSDVDEEENGQIWLPLFYQSEDITSPDTFIEDLNEVTQKSIKSVSF